MIMRRRTLLVAMVAGLVPTLATGQGRRPRLAILSPASRIGSGDPGAVYGPFTAALAALGWVREHNVDIVERFADFANDRLPGLAAELVSLLPDVIFTNTSPGAYAAAAATPTIPIVVGPAGEAALAKLAGNFARPSGNVTGIITTLALGQHEKCIELLHTVMPALTRVAVIINPHGSKDSLDLTDALQVTFRSRGLTLVRVDARGADEIDAAFAQMADEQVAAIHVPDDVAVVGHGPSRRRIIELALARRLPVTSTFQPFAADGGLAAFGADIPALARRAAAYVDKILKGAAPANLPVERPTVFKLAVNLKTARVLGLTLPPDILLRADEVIE